MANERKQFHLVASAVALGNRRGEVTVYSTIGRYKYGDNDPTETSNNFDKQLKALGDVDEITVRINSPGGVVSEAVAIRTSLMKHKAKKTVDIEGCCDSAATLIACLPGARVRMAKGGEYMIHRCSTLAWGHADDLLSAYNSATQTDKDMADIYAERTGKTKEECLELMKAETWYGADEAKEAGFVDELITGADDELELTACAVDSETMELMRSCYAHAPERAIKPGKEPDNNPVSNETSAVAAGNSAENNAEGVKPMTELKDATAEQLQQENPALVGTIAANAVTAERERVKKIQKLTPKGSKWETMARKFIDEGKSPADFLEAVVAEQEKTGAEYLTNRVAETTPAAKVGAGDSSDHDDDTESKTAQAAKDIAELAKGMSYSGFDMA